MANYSTSCSIRRMSGPYGAYFCSNSFCTTTELHSHMNDIFGYRISDYLIIKSRCVEFHENAFICSRHRYLLCEGYVPKFCCVFNHCHSTAELMQMGVQAALFIGYVPILGCICGSHRAFFEKEMQKKNLWPILYEQHGRLSIWDCVVKAPIPISHTGSALPKNRLVPVTTQPISDDHSSFHKSESETNKSIIPSTGLQHSPPVENSISKIKIMLSTKQDGDSFERDSHLNQQHQQSNASVLQNNVHVTQEMETNQGSRFARQSSASKSSCAESMEMQRFLQVKICASSSTSHKWQRITVLDTDTVATLKSKIIETFSLNNCSSNLSLCYTSAHSDDSTWKTVKIEEENRTSADLSFGDDYIVTCTISPKSPEKEPMRTVYPLPGLVNFGNTCFMNSALQCLNHVQPVFNYFHDPQVKTLVDGENTDKEKTSTLTRLYCELIESLCSYDGAVVPVAFHVEFGRLAPRFLNHHQQDSLEFMNILLDIFHEDLMRILQKDHSIISKTFHGQIRTVVTCKKCNRDVTTDDSFSFLPLPIPEDKNARSSHTRSYKLDQCFQTFLQGEYIGNNGQWYCEHCGTLTNAHKKLYLCELPPVLILQLKRFNYDLQSYTKINTSIEYDLDNLDLNEHVVPSLRDPSIRYNLIAVSNHWGSLIGGHFFTYAKLPGTQDWYEYNDEHVRKVDKNVHVNNKNAYILVYQQEENDSIIGTRV